MVHKIRYGFCVIFVQNCMGNSYESFTLTAKLRPRWFTWNTLNLIWLTST